MIKDPTKGESLALTGGLAILHVCKLLKLAAISKWAPETLFVLRPCGLDYLSKKFEWDPYSTLPLSLNS